MCKYNINIHTISPMQFNIDVVDYDVNFDSMCPEVPRCSEVPTAAESACESIASGDSDSESDIQSESECVDSTVAMTSKLKLAAGNYIVKSCIQVYCSIWKVVQIVIQNHFHLNDLHFYMHFFTVLVLQYVVLWK